MMTEAMATQSPELATLRARELLRWSSNMGFRPLGGCMDIDTIYREFSELLDAIDGKHLTVGDCNSARIALNELRKLRSPESQMHDCLVAWGKAFHS
jgi:hypothetical protein